MPAMRNVEGMIFECPSPSVWHSRDLPVTIAFNGALWQLSLVNKLNQRKSASFATRDEAIKCVIENCGGAK